MSFSFGVQAQLEGSKKIKLSLPQFKDKSSKVAPLKRPAIPKTEQVIKYEPEFFKPKSAINFVSTVPKVGEIEKKTYEVKSAQELFETQNQERESSVAVSLDSDVFLGEYVVYTPTSILKYRDFSAIDGDAIRIWINGQIVKDFAILKSDYESFECVLNEGLNIVQIEALNVGKYFPNTGGFILSDGNSKLLVNQNWALAEGFRGVFRIMRKNGINEIEEKK